MRGTARGSREQNPREASVKKDAGKTDKLRRFAYENKNDLIAFATLISLTALMCVPVVARAAKKAIGCAAWLCLAMGYAALVARRLKTGLSLVPSARVFFVVAVIFSVAALHIASLPKSMTATFPDYVVGSYETGGAGGALFGLITSPLAVGLSRAWGIAINILLAALFWFLFFGPFAFEGVRSPVTRAKRRPAREPECREIILDDSPFLAKGGPNAGAASYADADSGERRKLSAREILFGKKPTRPALGMEEHIATGKFIGDEPNAERNERARREEALALLFAGRRRERNGEAAPREEPREIFKGEKDASITDILSSAKASAARETRRIDDWISESETNRAEGSGDDESEASGPGDGESEARRSFGDAPDATETAEYARKEADVDENPDGGPETEEVWPGLNGFCEAGSSGSDETRAAPCEKIAYDPPPATLLRTHQAPNFRPEVENFGELKKIFEERLLNMNIRAELAYAKKGPTVTLCALKLDDKCPISAVRARISDIQRIVESSRPLAVLSQIPGTEYCGIQIPNKVRGLVGFKEVFLSDEYKNAKGDILIALGRTSEGDILVKDLAAMPHALVAGMTGSGKSVCLNVMLASIVFRYSPDEVKLLLIDMKRVEMSLYAGIPHMLAKNPLSNPIEIANALKWVREEMDRRFEVFKSARVRDIKEYNERIGAKKYARLVIVIDEASELMDNQASKTAVESTLNSLSRMGRAAGVHMVFATQNPTKKVITNEIQNNMATKIAFAVGDYVHSQVIFKANGAECLLGKGDMYIKTGTEMRRGQCALITSEELTAAIEHIRSHNRAEFDEAKIRRMLNGDAESREIERKTLEIEPEPEEKPDNQPDDKWKALKLIVDNDYVSVSFLQRKMNKGYNACANIVERLEAEGFVTKLEPGTTNKKRECLISKEEFQALWNEKFGDVDSEGL